VQVYKHYPTQGWLPGTIAANNGSVMSVMYANQMCEHLNAATPTWIRILP
jgi:hypothetical protein